MNMDGFLASVAELNRYGVIQIASAAIILIGVAVVARLAASIRNSLRMLEEQQRGVIEQQKQLQLFEQRLRIFTRLLMYCDEIKEYRGQPDENYNLGELHEIVVQAPAFFDRSSSDNIRELYDRIALETKNMAAYIMTGQKNKWTLTINEIWGLMDSLKNELYVKYIDMEK